MTFLIRPRIAVITASAASARARDGAPALATTRAVSRVRSGLAGNGIVSSEPTCFCRTYSPARAALRAAFRGRLETVAAGAGVRTRQPLEVRHRQPPAGDGDGIGIPAGRDQPGERRRGARRRRHRLRKVDRGDGIEAAERHPQPVTGERQRVRVEPLGPPCPAGRDRVDRPFANAFPVGGERDQRVGIVARREHPAIGQRQQRGRLGDRLRPRDDVEAVVGDRQGDQFAVARARHDRAARRDHRNAERIGAARHARAASRRACRGAGRSRRPPCATTRRRG